MMARVVITGIGIVSPIGADIDTFWGNVLTGTSGIAPIDDLPTEHLRCRVAAQVRDFKFADHFGFASEAGFDRVSQFAVVAARSAMMDAAIVLSDAEQLTTPTIIGTGAGGMTTLDDNFLRLYHKRIDRLHPMTIPALMSSACASKVSIDLGTKGPAFAVSGACASGAQAIALAFNMVRSGACKVAISGGTEACITFGTLKGWEALKVMSNDTCRPFSKTRSGMVLGEGACVLVLEDADRAAKRGARIYGELIGTGMTSDAHSMIAPNLSGAARAMSLALADAQCDSAKVDYVNAHGTGTIANDETETAAIHTVFGGGSRSSIAVSASKAVLGHALGAAGALEAAITVLSVFHSIIPPTANFEEADPACDLNLVVNGPQEKVVDFALSNSFAFGGLNTSLVFRTIR